MVHAFEFLRSYEPDSLLLLRPRSLVHLPIRLLEQPVAQAQLT